MGGYSFADAVTNPWGKISNVIIKLVDGFDMVKFYYTWSGEFNRILYSHPSFKEKFKEITKDILGQEVNDSSNKVREIANKVWEKELTMDQIRMLREFITELKPYLSGSLLVLAESTLKVLDNSVRINYPKVGDIIINSFRKYEELGAPNEK